LLEFSFKKFTRVLSPRSVDEAPARLRDGPDDVPGAPSEPDPTAANRPRRPLARRRPARPRPGAHGFAQAIREGQGAPCTDLPRPLGADPVLRVSTRFLPAIGSPPCDGSPARPGSPQRSSAALPDRRRSAPPPGSPRATPRTAAGLWIARISS